MAKPLPVELSRIPAHPVLTPEEVLQGLSAIASVSMSDYVTFDGKALQWKGMKALTAAQRYAISSMESYETWSGERLKVKLYDKAAALGMLARIYGLFDPPAGIDPQIMERFLEKVLQYVADPEAHAALVGFLEAEFRTAGARRLEAPSAGTASADHGA